MYPKSNEWHCDSVSRIMKHEPECRAEIFEYIALLVSDETTAFTDVRQTVQYHFVNRLSYHFALLLQNRFERGDIVWQKFTDRLYWRDTDGHLYNAYGMQKERCKLSFVPFDMLDEKYKERFIGCYNNKQSDNYNTILQEQLRTAENILRYETVLLEKLQEDTELKEKTESAVKKQKDVTERMIQLYKRALETGMPEEEFEKQKENIWKHVFRY